MSIFGDQSERLLRETWASPSELAEELYAMFGVNTPLQIQGPVEITNTTPGPALTVKQLGAFDAGGFPPGLKPDDPAAISLQFPGLSPTPADVSPPVTQQNITQNTLKPGGGGGVPGQIVSGSGDTYDVDLYEKGVAAGVTKTVSVTQLQIDPAETINAGTWTLVTQAGDGYFMQVPVWGAP
jgi:hypothetical protein